MTSSEVDGRILEYGSGRSHRVRHVRLNGGKCFADGVLELQVASSGHRVFSDAVRYCRDRRWRGGVPMPHSRLERRNACSASIASS